MGRISRVLNHRLPGDQARALTRDHDECITSASENPGPSLLKKGGDPAGNEPVHRLPSPFVFPLESLFTAQLIFVQLESDTRNGRNQIRSGRSPSIPPTEACPRQAKL